MTNGWTPERKARQAELIRSWKPWERSTGPRTAQGKTASSQNVQGGQERRKRELAQAQQELNAAVAKIARLIGKSKLWWELL